MADPSWLDKNNITSVRLKTSTGTVEIGQLEAFGQLGQFILVTLYSLTTFFALIGNTLVILVEIYGRRSARNLQKFLINLAISDLLLGVFVAPFVYTDIMLGRWIFHPLLCPATQFVQLMSVFVTTYTLTFIGIERYFATLHPLSTANTWLRSHGNLVLQLGWIFGATLASFSIQNIRVVAFKYDNQTYYDCANWVDVTERDMQIYVLLSFILTFVLPIIFLTISYGAIGRRLMRTQKYWCSYKQTVPFSQHSRTHSSMNSSSNTSSDNNHNHHHNHNAKRTAKTIMVTVNDSGRLNESSHSSPSKNNNNNNGGGNSQNGSGSSSSHSNTNVPQCTLDSQDSARHSRSKSMTDPNKVVVFRLLVAVLVLFIICWLPIKIFMLILAFFPSIVYLDTITSYYTYYVSFFLCHWLSMANSFANPILYCFMSKSFRADLLDLFVCICTRLNICMTSCEKLKENQPYVYNQPRHLYNGHNYRLASIKEAKDLDKDVIKIVDVKEKMVSEVKDVCLEITNIVDNDNHQNGGNNHARKKHGKLIGAQYCLSGVDELSDIGVQTESGTVPAQLKKSLTSGIAQQNPEFRFWFCHYI